MKTWTLPVGSYNLVENKTKQQQKKAHVNKLEIRRMHLLSLFRVVSMTGTVGCRVTKIKKKPFTQGMVHLLKFVPK